MDWAGYYGQGWHAYALLVLLARPPERSDRGEVFGRRLAELARLALVILRQVRAHDVTRSRDGQGARV